MQFNIFINQQAIIKNKWKLDITDAAVVVYMKMLCSSVSRKVETKRRDGFTWFNYQHMINELPLANINYNSLKNHIIPKIKKTGLFEFKIMNNADGKMTYIKPTAKLDLLDRDKELQ
jgi:hypothetical protein